MVGPKKGHGGSKVGVPTKHVAEERLKQAGLRERERKLCPGPAAARVRYDRQEPLVSET